jgi:2-amino-4-hydroxy-6-hydroxymethyldihydropteridine diphosphokinase
MDVVVGLGANLGDLYASAPIGPPQPRFLNAAARLLVDADAGTLLARLLAVEAGLGRTRRERWEPRIIDLDLLWIRGISVRRPGLVVPHGELHTRRFALAPLLDVAPDAAHPETGVPYRTLLGSLGHQDAAPIEGPGWALPGASETQ